eukprot:scaffold774_cov248-Pinguiococcus_pyrenoidosus.AAC.22
MRCAFAAAVARQEQNLPSRKAEQQAFGSFALCAWRSSTTSHSTGIDLRSIASRSPSLLVGKTVEMANPWIL